MDLSQYKTEAIRAELQGVNKWLEKSYSLRKKQGGWIFWNGDEEERMEKYARQLKQELNKRP